MAWRWWVWSHAGADVRRVSPDMTWSLSGCYRDTSWDRSCSAEGHVFVFVCVRECKCSNLAFIEGSRTICSTVVSMGAHDVSCLTHTNLKCDIKFHLQEEISGWTSYSYIKAHTLKKSSAEYASIPSSLFPQHVSKPFTAAWLIHFMNEPHHKCIFLQLCSWWNDYTSERICLVIKWWDAATLQIGDNPHTLLKNCIEHYGWPRF